VIELERRGLRYSIADADLVAGQFAGALASLFTRGFRGGASSPPGGAGSGGHYGGAVEGDKG
jgi:hypothetical protein